MRLLSEANLGPGEKEETALTISEWSGVSAGAELESILARLRSPETRQ